MKKLISLILALSVIFSLWVMPASVSASAETEKGKNRAELLYELGAIDEEMKIMLQSDTEVTREQFAQLIFEAAKLNGGNTASFADVENTSPYLAAISAVNQNKIMMGDGNGSFNPAAYVTELEAMISVLRVLGYEEYSQFNGGYPTGYYTSARKTDILDGIGEASAEYIKGSDLSVLIKNMLDEPFYEITSIGENSFDKKLTDESFLTVNYGIKKAEGVMTGNTGTLLNKVKETGGLMIDGVFIPTENSGYDVLIGMNCEAYYDSEDGSLIYIEESDKNRVQVITAEMLTDVKGRSIIYEVREGKEDTVTFPSDAYILYNGRFLELYSDTLFDDMKTGEIKLIDNDGDGQIEVVSIFSYQTLVIDSVNSIDSIISFKYGGGTLTENDLKDAAIYDENGVTDLDWLHEWDALDILRDDQGTIIAVYAAGKVERKKATEAVLDSANGYIVFDDGTIANIHPDALGRLEGIELNIYSAFSFDMFGNIIAYTKDTLDKICVIISIGETNKYEPDLMIKYYTENGEILEKTVTGTIKFNNETRKMSDETNYKIVRTALQEAKGELVEIRMGTDGEIESISIMEKVYDSNGSGVNTYLNNYANAVIPSATVQYFVKKNANAFYIPSSLTGVKEDDFIVKKAIKCGTKTTAVAVYKKLGSTDIDCDAVSFRTSGGGFDGMGSYDNPMLVSGKSKVYVEDEDAVYTKLTYWHTGGEKTAYVSDESKIASIDEGDVCWIDVDEDTGEIIGVVKYFDYSENKEFPPETAAPKALTSSRRMYRGYVLRTHDELYEQAIPLKIASKDSGGNTVYTESEVTELHRYPTYGYVFDSTKGEKVRKATAADFIGYDKDSVNYSRIFVHCSYTTDYMAVIYK